MNHRRAMFGLSLFGLCCLAAQSVGATTDASRQPLKLGLVAAPAQVLREPAQHRMQATATDPRAQRFTHARDQVPLRERALQSVIAGSEMAADDVADVAGQPRDRFRFEKRGNAAKDLSRGYRDMCARVSSRVWDEPNGRRIKFDIAGKPGVAFEIPIH